MNLGQLLADQPGLLGFSGDSEITITRIVADSRQALPGALFVAYRGVGVDGYRFIPDAVARGAAAVIGEQQEPPGMTVPYAQVRDGREALAWLHASWHGHPSRNFTLVGITGTDGKTTTASLLYSILAADGRHAGLISTVSAVIGDRTYDTGLHTTTPDAPEVQSFLAQMRDAGTEVAVLETTSHGLAQHRVTGCLFDVAVVTNITHEHLDFHGTYEAYRSAKAMLFRSLLAPELAGMVKTGAAAPAKTAVLNRDDSSYEYLAAIPAARYITYGIGDPLYTAAPAGSKAPVIALTVADVVQTPAGIDMIIAAGEDAGVPVNAGALHLSSPLVGRFNVHNILAACGAALALGVPHAAIRQGVAAVGGVPGRMERISRGQAFTAIVDFAHTPNALRRALETARDITMPGGRVIVVFGSAGLRDRAKRRLMGAVAAELADLTVITAEDPRTEDLDAILAETAGELLAVGRTEGDQFLRVPDRQQAIVRAVRAAAAGDVVIVCGKGHEQSMCFGAVEHPWRDQEALRWALDSLQGEAGPPPFLLPTWTQ